MKVLSLLIIGLAVVKSINAQEFESFENASYSFNDSLVVVSTGLVERTWQWTGKGLKTISYKNIKTGKEWITTKSENECDFNLPSKINNESNAQLTEISVTKTDDEKFTSKHLLVSADMYYTSGIYIKYLIRVYPNAPGIYTQLKVKISDNFDITGIPLDTAFVNYYGSMQPIKIARSEFLAIDFSQPNQRRYWGLYNDPGARVNTKNMVKEEIVKGWPIFQDEQNLWASGVSIQAPNEGLIVVKESNKTVNKYGHQTGAFYCTRQGIEVTGWGLKPNELSDEYRTTWATWTILYNGKEPEMELALKEFDRIRYPVNLSTDMYLLIDTWGSDYQNNDKNKLYGRENSEFNIVKNEIKSASELGIDIVRIDDGWQEGSTFSKNSWHPNPNVGYDKDWKNVTNLSEKYKVKIGLWANSRYISDEELYENQTKLNTATWKFDFDKIESWEDFDKRKNNAKKFIKDFNYQTQISWCPEYDDTRYGWYSPVREVGPMYFQNIQNNLPKHVIYVPYITLKHHWMMARYYNLNDLQCNWQNPALTDTSFSDAYKHSQSYAAMTAFAGIPVSFMLTQLLTPNEKTELKSLIEIYKKERTEIFNSYVMPIGDEPNNASYSGFQIFNPNKNTGYFMIFRELHNTETHKQMQLKFLENKKLRITNLVNNKISNPKINAEGYMEFKIEKPADFLFLKYEIL